MVKLRIGKVKARNSTKPLYHKIYHKEESVLKPPVIAAPEPLPPPKPAPKPEREPRRKISVAAVNMAVYDAEGNLAPFNVTFFGISMPDFWTSPEGARAQATALRRHNLDGYSLRPHK